MNSIEIYNKIIKIIENKGWTVNKLSTEAELSHSTLYGWHSRKTMPTIEILEKICTALNYPLSKLLFDTEMEALSEEQKQVMELWGILDRDEKNAVLNLLKAMAKERE